LEDVVTKLERLNADIIALTDTRDAVLKALRRECTHLRLAELESSPPHRMCLDCGAEERGWYCGYQVLALKTERTDCTVERGVVRKMYNSHNFYSLRKPGPLYLVGQSHPNFAKGGWLTYQDLTEQ
jgi:hypothetical protein